MNPMTNVKNIKKLSEQELRRNLKTSWHDQYRDSAWVFVGGLPYDLTEGDVICVFSQYGEVVNLNLVRDKDSGKPKGYCFLCYEDQRSTDLAVDNFNGIKLLGRTLRVDHVQNYKAPKDSEKKDAETRRLQEEGCAPAVFTAIKKEPDVKKEKLDTQDDCMIIERAPSVVDLVGERGRKEIKSESKNKKKKEKKASKEKEADKKKKKRKRRRSSSSSSSSGENSGSDSDSSSAESDSSEERARPKKNSHKQAKKKKSKQLTEGLHNGETNASSTRRKLEEKIKALEKALKNVRSGKNKQEKT
ncbi:hypothetical protein R5R35_002139 [Gryllus longicercus]|uniref:RRM domain-containing protein n=1 Tax=Gryllus longicercus TaxID=2509291 RepID=A0AAN9VP37_9ORTH